jgi:hypothetical protein
MDAIVNLKVPVNGNRAKPVSLRPESGTQWYFPGDSSIDLAAIGFPMKDEYDAMRIPISFFYTQDVWKDLTRKLVIFKKSSCELPVKIWMSIHQSRASETHDL